MRLVIVEDDKATLDGLALILAGEGGIEIAGTHLCAEDALASLEKEAPEVMLVDLKLPRMSGLELIGRAKALRPELEILVNTVFDDAASVFAALKAGATGYVLKGAKLRALVEAVTELYAGGAPMSPRIARMVILELQGEGPNGRCGLTAREQDVLRAMDRRLGYKEIAAQLGVSPHTVRTHIRNVYEKLQAKTREEALRKARRANAI